MQASTVKAVIQGAGGPEYLLGFRFANGYKLVYSRNTINIDEDFVEIDGVELLVFHHVDNFGNEARSFLEISEIAHIYVRNSLEGKIFIRDFME